MAIPGFSAQYSAYKSAWNYLGGYGFNFSSGDMPYVTHRFPAGVIELAAPPRNGGNGIEPPDCTTTSSDCGADCRRIITTTCTNGKVTRASQSCCNAPEICASGICCWPGEVNCAGNCVDASTDPANCGQCGVACPMGGCVDGKCQCPPPRAICDGKCVNLCTDKNNCGKCGNNCGNEDYWACSAGTCAQF